MDEASLRPYREYHARREQELRKGLRETVLLREKFLILERSIQKDLEDIDRLYQTLGVPDLSGTVPIKELIFIAFLLHGLYTIFETSLRNIATAFEKNLEETGWQRDLLYRMRLDLTPLRPAVIDDQVYEKLDEMRCFRDAFRTMYGVDPETQRLQIAVRKVLELKPFYKEQIGRFLEFLRAME
jgi:hypothetical protein